MNGARSRGPPGAAKVALIGYASRQRQPRNRKRAISLTDGTLAAQFERPTASIFHRPLRAQRRAAHASVRTTLEQLARVAVAARQWARLNPRPGRATR